MTIVRNNLSDTEYHKVVDDIVNRMRNLKDDDGVRMVKNAWKREEIFSGEFAKDIPDVIFLANDNYEPEYHLSLGIISDRPLERLTGVHDTHREGILMASGPDFSKGKSVGKVNIMDLAPTLLYMFGAKVPDDMDGRVLKELFRKGFEPRKVVHIATTSSKEKMMIRQAARRIRI